MHGSCIEVAALLIENAIIIIRQVYKGRGEKELRIRVLHGRM